MRGGGVVKREELLKAFLERGTDHAMLGRRLEKALAEYLKDDLKDPGQWALIELKRGTGYVKYDVVAEDQVSRLPVVRVVSRHHSFEEGYRETGRLYDLEGPGTA